MNEANIRDLLVHQLDCIEPSLQFLEKEKYLPSTIGTNSFVDILARDIDDNWVVVELKRSTASSRQAIHEVLKYAQAVKDYLGARDDEIRIMIASTVWDELLIPFSKFCSDSSSDISGFLINISNEVTLTAEKVIPLTITIGRSISPWHELNLFTTKENLEIGVKTYVHANKLKAIFDYVLVILEAPAGHHQMTLRATREALSNVHRRFQDDVDVEEIDAVLENMEEYRYILYFAPQLRSKQECLNALDRVGENMKELAALLENMDDEEEVLCTLHAQLFDAMPRPYRESFEIGYPAKFSTRLLDQEGWSLIEIRRYGSFSRNQLLTDDTIISEICGETGVSGQKFKRIISMSSRSQVAAARAEIVNCLSGNPSWRVNLLAHLEEILKEFPGGQVDISVFNPCTGLFTLFFAASREDGLQYVPAYRMVVYCDGKAKTSHFGQLGRGPNRRTFREIIDRFYNGDLSELLMSGIWGFREERDAEILEEIGISYLSFRCDIDGDDLTFFERRDGRWKECGRVIPFQSLNEFLEQESTFMKHLVVKAGRRMNGGIVDGSSPDRLMEELVESPVDGEQYDLNELASLCDVCGCAFEEENYLVDAMVPGAGGLWASLCADCYDEAGASIGWGRGQLYRRVQTDTWQLVAGGPPEAGCD